MTSSYEIPVVLPVMRFHIGADDHMDVTIDGEPFDAADNEVRGRASVRPIVDNYAQTARTPVRVEIVEVDGTTFTDIVTPTEPPATPPSVSGGETQPGPFKPGELVLVAAAVAERAAGPDGSVPDVRLPPAFLAAQRVALIGRDSAAVVLLGETW